jgi:hypothetical protein
MESGDFRFLEVNAAPIFSTLDHITSGALFGAILDWLMAHRRRRGALIRQIPGPSGIAVRPHRWGQCGLRRAPHKPPGALGAS